MAPANADLENMGRYPAVSLSDGSAISSDITLVGNSGNPGVIEFLGTLYCAQSGFYLADPTGAARGA